MLTHWARRAAAAGLATPEEGEAQLLVMLNEDREVKLRSHRVLEVLADWQACANARRHAIGEFDDLGQDFRARCLVMGLIGKTLANVTADEFYFRTTHAYGGSLIFDAMVGEALEKRYDFAAVRCVPGDDGLFYWCIVFCRAERMDRLAVRDVPRRHSASSNVARYGVRSPCRLPA